MTLQLTRQRLSSAKIRIDRHIDTNLFAWAREEILEPIRNDMREAGFSERAINSLNLERAGFMKVNLVWDFRGPNGEPLHFYIEFDTAPHTIRAKGKAAGGADYLHWTTEFGNDIFRRKVEHPGTTGKMIVHNGYDKRKDKLKQRIITETENFMAIQAL